MLEHKNNPYHTPVLLEEVIAALHPAPGKKVIDATLGGGGHSKAIAERGLQVLAIDQDEDAIREAKKWLAQFPTITAVEGSFEELGHVAQQHGFQAVDGILFDLGVSSHQLETKDRGFSFLYDAPLDMRMSKKLTVTANDLVHGLGEKELTKLFEKLGEEHHARKIAKAIVTARKAQPLETTGQLAQVVGNIVGRKPGGIHPATRVFQALRMAVNSELEALQSGLQQAMTTLGAGGVIAVISFHSLEDKMVKQQFLDWEKQQLGTVVTKKPVISTETEVAANPRARSAKLRVFKKNI